MSKLTNHVFFFSNKMHDKIRKPLHYLAVLRDKTKILRYCCSKYIYLFINLLNAWTRIVFVKLNNKLRMQEVEKKRREQYILLDEIWFRNTCSPFKIKGYGGENRTCEKNGRIEKWKNFCFSMISTILEKYHTILQTDQIIDRSCER